MTAAIASPPAPGMRRPWGRALLWLAGLGPFFFLSYGAANHLAALHAHVGAVVFPWERSIPFLPWTIVPYWSIDVFYGLSVFLCADAAELDTHGRRLLTAQIVAVTCFVLFPLRFTFLRPATHGLDRILFDSLTSFDLPFNQAPSLHIALLVILWKLYARHLPRWARWPLHLWFALVGVSVLTTYQHHFIDVPTGALLGFLCLYLWPDGAPSPLAGAALAVDPKRRRLAAGYGAGSLVLAALAVVIGGAGLWLLWPAVALVLVALNYAALGAAGFQKAPDGRVSLAAAALLAPYRLGAWVNSRAWTRRERAPAAIRDGVFLGRMPSAREAAEFAAIVDLCAELPGTGRCRAVPMLDLATPPRALLTQAAGAIEAARVGGSVLVCCALGYSRSAAAVATWLLATGRAATLEAAVAEIARVRPRIVLDAASRAAIAAAARCE